MCLLKLVHIQGKAHNVVILFPHDVRLFLKEIISSLKHALIQRRGGGQGVQTPPPLKNHKNIGVLSNTRPVPLKNYKAAKPVFNVGPSSARQRNAIKMTFRWRADNGPIILVPPSKTYKIVKVGPLRQNFPDPRMQREQNYIL